MKLSVLRLRLKIPWDETILVRVTNLGLGYVFTTIVVAIGATNTGNNGLYVLLSLLLGILLVSGVVSRRNVDGVDVALHGPAEVFAGEPVRFHIRLANRTDREKFALLVKVSGKAAPLLFPRLVPAGDAERGVDLLFPRRGRQKVESVLVFSGYPIGLFRKGRLHPVNEERIVYPRPKVAAFPPPEAREAVDDGIDPRRKGRGAEILKLREAAPGDDPRDIHWPQTARQGRPIVKERASELGREIVVHLETARPARAGADWDAAFEEAVGEAAGLVLKFLSRGERVGLFCGDQFVPPAMGPLHRSTVLTALALAEAGTGGSLPLALPPGIAIYRVRAAA
ncbi:MAG: DUF58 domain-containing protein [Holophagales bacterium]|nr:DUF58 domain-containing protein [Holophagales bacterium]